MKFSLRELPKGICHRCEYRVRNIEDGSQPRMECGDKDLSKVGCYMYRPVSPVVLEPDKGEKRSMTAPTMIRGRSHGIGIAEVDLVYTEAGRRFCVYAKPKAVK